MSVFDVERLCSIVNGRWLQRPGDIVTQALRGIGTDSRIDLSGRAFIALRGERFDGHDYLDAAVSSGAALLIVDRDIAKSQRPRGASILRVEDARQALADLALAHRRSLTNATIIAITGTCGKTTTKSILHNVLSQNLRGSCAPHSFNNDIGVPLTLLAATPADDYVIVEIGTNAPGEVSHLAAIAEPDIAMITMIGRGHLAGLGAAEGILREKASLLTHLRPGGAAILIDRPAALRDFVPIGAELVLFGESPDAHVRLVDYGREGNVDEGAAPWRMNLADGRQFALALPGRHNAINALSALAVAQRLGLSDAHVASGLRKVRPEGMRLGDQRLGGVRVINDAYNANPDSMIAALATFGDLAAAHRRRMVVLGDMLELGGASAKLHAEVLSAVVELHHRVPLAGLTLVGPHFTRAAENTVLPDIPVRIVPVLTEATIGAILSSLQCADIVLLKGSRGMALEQLASALAARPGEPFDAPAAAPHLVSPSS